jgi:hypothetical protein
MVGYGGSALLPKPQTPGPPNPPYEPGVSVTRHSAGTRMSSSPGSRST